VSTRQRDLADAPSAEVTAVTPNTKGAWAGPAPADSAPAPRAEPKGVWESISETLRESRNWRELRRTPFGMTPVMILAMSGFFLQMNEAVFGLAAPEIVQDLDISLDTIIRLSGFVGFITIFAIIGVAYLADRHRRVPMFAGGLLLGGIVGGFRSQAKSALSLGTPQFAAASALTVSDVPTTSLLADYYPPENRGKIFAILRLFGVAGSVMVPALVARMIQRFGWKTSFAVLAVPVVIVAAYALLRLREPVRGYFERRTLGVADAEARVEDEPPSMGESFRIIFGIRTLRRLFMASILSSTGAVMIATFQGLFLFQEYQLDVGQRGDLAALTSLFILPGVYLGGGLTDSLLRRRPSKVLTVFGVFGIVASFSALVLPLRPPLWVLYVSLSVFGFVGALFGPAVTALLVNITPANVRTMGGALQGLSAIPGLVIGLPLASAIVSAYGLRSVLFLPVPLLLIGAIIQLTAAPFFEADQRSAFAAAVARNEWKKAQEAGRGKLLVCRDVSVEYSGVQVLFDVDFDVDEGEIIALLGTNGAGKSTLLRAISGTTQCSSGGIIFDGRDITYMPPHETARRGIVFMPGGRGVFPGLTVRENLALGTWMSEDQAEVRTQLEEVFEIFPVLADRADAIASNLSGGEQQMLSLAQAFLAKPKLLMIDELSLGLAPAVVGQLLDVVRKIHERGVTIIVVEQSVNVALALAQKAIFMEKGEVKFFGQTADLLARPDILRAVYVKGTGALTDGAPAAATRSERERRLLALETGPNLLEVDGITKRFGGLTALDQVSFDLRQGEVLGVIGPNGSGKTTLFEIISGFQEADDGTVRYEGVDITKLSPDQRARRKLIRRFQDAKLFPSLTVYETLLVSLEQRLEVHSALANAAGLPQSRKAERRVRLRADRLVELLELGSYQDKFVRELSTGLRRIVDLACVLATEPKLLLLDEPSSGIAQAEAEGLAPLLRRVRFETGCSILIIEHDMPLISAVSDELLALELGVVLTRGAPADVLNDERVIESYLGGSEEAVKRSGSLS
jgi:branched-chain amino acid transport system ATP-binding protein